MFQRAAHDSGLGGGNTDGLKREHVFTGTFKGLPLGFDLAVSAGGCEHMTARHHCLWIRRDTIVACKVEIIQFRPIPRGRDNS